MHLVHRDRNYIYNCWPREGESIAQALNMESGMTPKFDCVKSFMDTDAFHGFTLNMDLTLR